MFFIYRIYVYFIYKPALEDLESLMRHTKTFISCHSAITHMANSFENKIIDIIDESKKDWYPRFSSYLGNYSLVYRNQFNTLKMELLNIIDN